MYHTRNILKIKNAKLVVKRVRKNAWTTGEFKKKNYKKGSKIQMEILKMKIMTSKMSNSLDGLTSPLDTTKEQISKPEGTSRQNYPNWIIKRNDVKKKCAEDLCTDIAQTLT